MSKEMLEAFRILEEDKGIKKKISLKLSQNHCVQLIAVVMAKPESAAIEFNEKLVISVFIPFVKWWMKSLIAV